MTDRSKMPFGVHKGKQLADVPPDYLMWLYDNNKCFGELRDYIKENLEVLAIEIGRNKKKKNH